MTNRLKYLAAATSLFLAGCSLLRSAGLVYPPDIPNWSDYNAVRYQFGLDDDANVVGLVVVYSPEYESQGSTCNDGSYTSALGAGACSWHGGVQRISSWTTGPRYLVKYLLGTDGACIAQKKYSLEILKENDRDFFCKKGVEGSGRRFKEDRVKLIELVGWKIYPYTGSEIRVLAEKL
ncbi:MULTISPECIES: hypothetical protein [Vibrio]|uniref:hypothetical protein n=1 Tax=Vibrio TaxID=662 RepID=UPI001CDC894D|nr:MULTISPECIES: hypothetical protein [Vibrio]MDW2297732.1 hypothetical protein [Vibrio sp. 1404]HCG6384325.1 hypothetical protein [Vibrio parahaemolyticus]MCA2458831.1 hypothetical protein [Vibrio alginolyticus]MCA2464415.1 hypothetical protein [Vibrio alginolyticus]MDW2270802.1 hypothetical protein [Vibrio sp. 1394]